MAVLDNHNCAGCGKMVDGGTFCAACVRALRSNAVPRQLQEPAVPPILRASPKRRGKDKMTLPLFAEGVGGRPQHLQPNEPKRKNRKRRKAS
jgi:hypothetical protein